MQQFCPYCNQPVPSHPGRLLKNQDVMAADDAESRKILRFYAANRMRKLPLGEVKRHEVVINDETGSRVVPYVISKQMLSNDIYYTVGIGSVVMTTSNLKKAVSFWLNQIVRNDIKGDQSMALSDDELNEGSLLA